MSFFVTADGGLTTAGYVGCVTEAGDARPGKEGFL